MKQTIIALVGLSGIGKSTLLQSLKSEIDFQHLQASALIREARLDSGITLSSTDELRESKIDDNQSLLISGFSKTRDKMANLIVIDGHTIVDTPAGIVRIPFEVFKALHVGLFIFVVDEGASIAARRQKDSTRNRPSRSAVELEEHQKEALLNTYSCARNLKVPVYITTVSDVDGISAICRLHSTRN